MTDPDAKVLHGLDASRRAGWAKFFDAQDDITVLQDKVIRARYITLRLAVRIRYHNRLPADDPLVIEAERLIAPFEADPQGRLIIEKIRNESHP